MAKKKTVIAPPPLPPAVRVAIHPPKDDEPDLMCALADKCLAAGAANASTIGQSPYLAQITAANTLVKADITAANGGNLAAKSILLASTKKLHAAIMGHGSWVGSQMAGMTPADASAYAVLAGFTAAKAATHAAITAMAVKNGAVGSLLLMCEFPAPAGRCLSCTEYSTDGEKTWTRGPDTEKSHVNLPLVFTSGQAVAVRLRQFIRGTGYTQWAIFPMTVV